MNKTNPNMTCRIGFDEDDHPIITIKNAAIINPFKNFSGKTGEYNERGYRTYDILVTEEIANKLRNYDPSEKGIGVRIKVNPARDPNEEPQYSIRARVSFHPVQPRAIWHYNGTKSKVRVTEDTIENLDFVPIETVDCVLSPYYYSQKGQTGYTLYTTELRAHTRESVSYLEDDDIPEVGGRPKNDYIPEVNDEDEIPF